MLSDSDSEDKVPKKRVKPKIQLKTNPKREESGLNDSKPITSNNTTAEHTGADFERPKTSHGHQSQSDTPSSSSSAAAQPVEKSNKADILKLDATPEHLKQGTNISRSIGESSFNSTKIDFDDEDDDILSGMGLDDSNSKAITSSKQQQRQRSRLDELLGKKKPVAAVDENKKPIGPADDGEGMKVGEEDGFQFGGYLPSAATESSTTSGSKLPSSRRQQNSDSLTFRPSSAPGPAKKTVRFAEEVENTNRPSSSPAVNEAPKPAIKGTRKTGPPEQTLNKKEGNNSLSKRPPLPRKSEPAGLVATNKTQNMSQEIPQPEEQRGVNTTESNVTGSEESQVDNNNRFVPYMYTCTCMCVCVHIMW